MAVRSPLVYRWVGAALLRASTDPGGLDLPADLDLFGTDAAGARVGVAVGDVAARGDSRGDRSGESRAVPAG